MDRKLKEEIMTRGENQYPRIIGVEDTTATGEGALTTSGSQLPILWYNNVRRGGYEYEHAYMCFSNSLLARERATSRLPHSTTS